MKSRFLWPKPRFDLDLTSISPRNFSSTSSDKPQPYLKTTSPLPQNIGFSRLNGSSKEHRFYLIFTSTKPHTFPVKVTALSVKCWSRSDDDYRIISRSPPFFLHIFGAQPPRMDNFHVPPPYCPRIQTPWNAKKHDPPEPQNCKSLISEIVAARCPVSFMFPVLDARTP